MRKKIQKNMLNVVNVHAYMLPSTQHSCKSEVKN